ncbi:DUF305 domain-containing protein [Phormidium tenue FACHB-886]|nr:DUF305 domain-containing protein [Phormidium tenue FACHB-886]
MKLRTPLLAVVLAGVLPLTACNTSTNPAAGEQAPQETAQNPMPGMDHSTMDHGNMDHGNMDHSTMPGMNHGSMSMDLGPKDATFDLRFIDGMVPHHQGAVVMAQEALEKSQRPEIKQLAQAIIDAQEKEISELQTWRKSWYANASADSVMYDAQKKTDVPMTEQMRSSMMMEGDLGAADAEFDLRFINAMIPHHQGALDMAKQAQEKSDRPEIKQLAQEIITSQQQEIEQMEQWRKQWYNQ